MEGNRHIVVVSDDAELGGLIALNLRQRGHAVEHVALSRDTPPDWTPASGRPALIVLDLEAPERAEPALLRSLFDQPWARGVPLLVAVEGSEGLVEQPGRPVTMIDRPDDIGAIVAGARAFFASP